MVTLDQHECSHPVAPDLLARPRSWPARGRMAKPWISSAVRSGKPAIMALFYCSSPGRITPGHPVGQSAVEGPASAILATQQFVRFGAVGHLPGRAIILDLLAHAVGHQAQLHRLDHLAAVIEVAARLEAAFAGVDPLPLEIPDGRKQILLRARLVVGDRKSTRL